MNIDDYNNSYLEKVKDYLENNNRFITKDLVDRTMMEGLDEEDAVCALLSSIMNLDIVETEYYLKYGLKELDKEVYTNNPYYQNIVINDKTHNNIHLTYEEYKPYELFVCDDFIKVDGRVIPQLGYFTSEFKYPCIKESDNIWMLITPNEVNTMKSAIDNSYGRVITFGLGLGYYAYMVSNKENVKSITIIENNKDIIDLFKNVILPQFPNKEKINIINADAYEFSKNMDGYDYCFIDIYHDVSDGIDDYIYFKLRENKNIKYDYWIEKTIKCYF